MQNILLKDSTNVKSNYYRLVSVQINLRDLHFDTSIHIHVFLSPFPFLIFVHAYEIEKLLYYNLIFFDEFIEKGFSSKHTQNSLEAVPKRKSTGAKLLVSDTALCTFL